MKTKFTIVQKMWKNIKCLCLDEIFIKMNIHHVENTSCILIMMNVWISTKFSSKWTFIVIMNHLQSWFHRSILISFFNLDFISQSWFHFIFWLSFFWRVFFTHFQHFFLCILNRYLQTLLFVIEILSHY